MVLWSYCRLFFCYFPYNISVYIYRLFYDFPNSESVKFIGCGQFRPYSVTPLSKTCYWLDFTLSPCSLRKIRPPGDSSPPVSTLHVYLYYTDPRSLCLKVCRSLIRKVFPSTSTVKWERSKNNNKREKETELIFFMFNIGSGVNFKHFRSGLSLRFLWFLLMMTTHKNY